MSDDFERALEFLWRAEGGRADDIASGSCKITNNTIDPYIASTLGFRLQAGVSRAVVTGNDYGGHALTNGMGSGYVVASNLA